MSIPVACPSCGHAGNVPAQFRGRRVTCPQCGSQFAVEVSSPTPAGPRPADGAYAHQEDELEVVQEDELEVLPAESCAEADEELEEVLPADDQTRPFVGAGVSRQHAAQAKSELLLPGERIEVIVTGWVVDRTLRVNPVTQKFRSTRVRGGLFHTHYLIVTCQRVILWGRGSVLSISSVEAFSLSDIQNVEYRHNFLAGALVFSLPGKEAFFGRMHKHEAPIVQKAVLRKIAQLRAPAQRQHNRSDPDPAGQIGKLASLYKQGIISKREFEEKKQKLLDQI
jgi:hypothetical protein